MTKRQEKVRRFVGIGLVICVFLVLQACGASGAKSRIDSSQNMKVLGMAIIAFQGDNDGKPPEILDDVKEQAAKAATDMGVDKDFATLMKNPITGDDPGYEYVKPDDGVPVDTTIVLYQLRDGKRDESLPKCYLSGAVK